MTSPDTMAAVLRQPIDLAALPRGTPTAVRRSSSAASNASRASGCATSARRGWRSNESARHRRAALLLQPESRSRSHRDPRGRYCRGSWRPTVAALVALLGALLGPRAQPSVPAPVTRLVSNIGVPGSLMVDAGPAAVLSPDGRTIVFRVRRENTPRRTCAASSSLDPIELAYRGRHQSLFSPDGTQLGFFASGGLKTMPVAGGAIATLTDAGTGRGAAWAANGDIVFQSSLFPKTPLLRINAAGARTDGGTTLAPEETTHRWPQILPGGQPSSGNGEVSEWDKGTCGSRPSAASPGRSCCAAATTHGTCRLDTSFTSTLGRLRRALRPRSARGHVAARADHRKRGGDPGTGGAQYSIASNGTLAYVPGHTASLDNRMHWLLPDGRTTPLKRFTPVSGAIRASHQTARESRCRWRTGATISSPSTIGRRTG